MQLVVRDLQGRPVFRVDTTEDVARAVDSDKVVATRVDKTDHEAKVAMAARWMGGAERKVLLDLGPADVIKPPTEAEFGIPHQTAARGERIADIVSPVTFVKHDRGVWFQESALDAALPPNCNAAGDGQYAEINPGYSTTTFTTNGFALAGRIPFDVENNADFDLRKRTIRRVVEGLLLAREVRVANLLTKAASYAAANQVAAVAKWSGGTNPGPLTDLFKALLASVIPADTLILAENVAQYFYYLTGTGMQIRDYVQGGGRLPRIITATGKYSSGSGAGAIVPNYIWAPGTTGWTAPVVRVGGDDPDTDILTSRTFRWLGDKGVRDGAVRDGVLVREYADEKARASFVVVAHSDVEVIQNSSVGALLTTLS